MEVPKGVIDNILGAAHQRWLKAFEVLTILQNFDRLGLPVTNKTVSMPPSGSLFLFNKKTLPFYRSDGHSWRKKKDGKSVAEHHEKLRIGGVDVINCYYAHHEANPFFHRRVYWLLNKKESNMVLVQYLDLSRAEEQAQLARQPIDLTRGTSPARSATTGTDLDDTFDSVVSGYETLDRAAAMSNHHQEFSVDSFFANDAMVPGGGAFVTVDPVPDMHAASDASFSAAEDSFSAALHQKNGITLCDANGPPADAGPMFPQFLDGTGVPGVRASVFDFSPSWDYAAGGAKILITGVFEPLPPGEVYWAMFDGVPVACAPIIQNVLRCHAPPHAPGMVQFYLTRGDGVPCSEMLAFEYRERRYEPRPAPWFAVNDMDFQTHVMERFEQLERSLRDHQAAAGDASNFGGFGGGGGGGGLFRSNAVAPAPHRTAAVPVSATRATAPAMEPTSTEGALTVTESVGSVVDRIVAQMSYLMRHTDPTVLSAKINARDIHGTTILHYASAAGIEKLATLLLEHGATPDVADMDGRTPLHWAAMTARDDAVVPLLLHGADRSLPDHLGLTALNYAMEMDSQYIIKLLRSEIFAKHKLQSVLTRVRSRWREQVRLIKLAAVKIQSVFRGHRTRAHIDTQKVAKSKIVRWFRNRHSSHERVGSTNVALVRSGLRLLSISETTCRHVN